MCRRSAKEQLAVGDPPGSRVPRTRKAIAAAAAFDAEASGKSEGNRKRPASLPGQTVVPPTVDDVDKQRSFTMFDAGWILPPDQKRGGRAPVERQAGPPPRKRMRTGWW